MGKWGCLYRQCSDIKGCPLREVSQYLLCCDIKGCPLRQVSQYLWCCVLYVCLYKQMFTSQFGIVFLINKVLYHIACLFAKKSYFSGIHEISACYTKILSFFPQGWYFFLVIRDLMPICSYENCTNIQLNDINLLSIYLMAFTIKG